MSRKTDSARQAADGRMRLDRLLVARGLFASRSRAADAVRRGHVRVDGRIVRSPGERVAENARLETDDPAKGYVSRAALKLLAALETWPADLRGAVCLDIGASTGGFVQVLLERGAKRVYAVDVGHGQLHADLLGDARVVSLEGVNARMLSGELVPERVDVITADVSFISLRKALPPALSLARPGARLWALVKPQFEAGPQAVGGGGIVRDAAVREAVVADVRRWLEEEEGWQVAGTRPSPLRGGDGNVEYLLHARKEG
jgi:23S rRNA (cytidine1920-2'-O)/16S rRNA (cytidine1409-2'-O)-methyltransferase